MATDGIRPDLKVTIPPSNELPCECMMCTILKDLTKEEQGNLPCLRRIPTRYLVEKGIVSRRGFERKPRSEYQELSPIELPAELPAELLAKLPVELPAEVPSQLPAESSTKAVAKLPTDVPVELPADPPASQQEEEQINGIPLSVVLVLRQIYKETEGIVSPDASPIQDADEPSTASTDTRSDSSQELPEPSIRFSIDKLIDEGRPQAWPHPESVLMVSDVGNVERRPTVVSPSMVQRAVPQAASVGFSEYIAWCPRFDTSASVGPYSPGYGDSPQPQYQAYSPGCGDYPQPQYQAYNPDYEAFSPQPKYQAYRHGL
ncbi:hypothetical protein IWZ03DRAFT_413765 [Phyllosticta citriasiana]|uniref:Uncharacterized protein n=1 Tax=Phyllosticta citriasiana TaxID=595635 RepID=A0ABR1KPT3_9PEZI